ncbi:YqiA/YcfP family alpha/beta fold hydrolase [Pontiellaceae bacterium B1224]|nr:YqiA/YcfP family alpha/beta fold hydrolase [Pontiellaceae bacterium B1224]
MVENYEQILNTYRQVLNDEELVFVKRDVPSDRLLVSLATHNNHGKYASLVTYFNQFDGDVLFLADRKNSYYLENDRGRRYKTIVAKFVKNYSSEKIVFTGASMAGYAALNMALFFNANAVVNNPQVNLDLTLENSWDELRNNIEKIGIRENIEENTYVTPHRNSVIAALFGRHKLDIANMQPFFEIFTKIPGVGLLFGHCHDQQHGYYYPNVEEFFAMVDKVIEHRRFMTKVNQK